MIVSALTGKNLNKSHLRKPCGHHRTLTIQQQRTPFFVFIIESPSAVDLYDRRSEGDVIRQAVGLNGIPCFSVLTINREAFLYALHIGLKQAMDANLGFVPVLHISAHGSPEGIQLSDRSILTWAELEALLTPLNKAFNNCLFVCMSTCNGYAGTRMAMVQDHQVDLPFFALIGCSGEPTWPETAIGFATLYHHIAKGTFVPEAVAAMRTASGNEKFFL